MDNIKIVDLLASLSKYIPHSKGDVLALLGQIWDLLLKFNGWLASVIGVDIQKIANSFSLFFTKYFAIGFNFVAELVKRLLGKL